jgi:hypothetical protein
MRHYYILKEQQLLHKINGPHHLFSLGRPMVHVLAPSPYDLGWGKAAADHISRSCHVIAIVSTLRLHCSTAENQRKRDCSRSFQSAATVLILSLFGFVVLRLKFPHAPRLLQALSLATGRGRELIGPASSATVGARGAELPHLPRQRRGQEP